jgi:hypothetical protein
MKGSKEQQNTPLDLVIVTSKETGSNKSSRRIEVGIVRGMT